MLYYEESLKLLTSDKIVKRENSSNQTSFSSYRLTPEVLAVLLT